MAVDSLSLTRSADEMTQPGPLGAGGRCCSDWKLDTFLDGEMSAAAADEVERHLAAAPACRTRADELRQARAEFASALPPRRIVRAEVERSNVIRVAFGGTVAAVAMAAGVMVMIGRGDATATKGTTSAVIYAHDGSNVRVVDDGGVVHPGDALRFSVRAASPCFVAVVSKDGRGGVMAYAPVEGEAVAVAAGAEVPLPGAVKLDDVLGREELTVWSCDTAVAVADLVKDVEAGVAHGGCRRSQLLLNKVAE